MCIRDSKDTVHSAPPAINAWPYFPIPFLHTNHFSIITLHMMKNALPNLWLLLVFKVPYIESPNCGLTYGTKLFNFLRYEISSYKLISNQVYINAKLGCFWHKIPKMRLRKYRFTLKVWNVSHVLETRSVWTLSQFIFFLHPRCALKPS